MVEEETLLVWIGPTEPKIVLDRIGVEEVLRRLHKTHCRVVKQRQAALHEAMMRHEIGIQYCNEIRRLPRVGQHAQRMVYVARLGPLVVRAGHIFDTDLCAILAQPVALAVIKHIDCLAFVLQ